MKCFSLRFAFFRCFVVCVALTLLAFGTAAAEFADFSSLYPDTFLPAGSEPQWTEDSYTSENMAVKITAQRVNDADVYVADIHVRTVECLQRSFAGGKWDYIAQSVKAHAEETNAVVALTGDNGHLISVGWVLGNGEILRSSSNNKRDLCVLYRDGTMVTHYARVDNALISSRRMKG